jgi:hypothetical protein
MQAWYAMKQVRISGCRAVQASRQDVAGQSRTARRVMGRQAGKAMQGRISSGNQGRQGK